MYRTVEEGKIGKLLNIQYPKNAQWYGFLKAEGEEDSIIFSLVSVGLNTFSNYRGADYNTDMSDLYNTDILTAITPLTWKIWMPGLTAITPLSSNFQKIFYISELGLFKSKIKVSETLQKRAKAVNWIISIKKFL